MKTQLIYTGTMCKKCGGTQRYISSYGCVACSAARAKSLTPEQRAAKKAYNDSYISEHGKSYTKEEMKEYNRVYNARKKGVNPDTYRIRGEIPLDERILDGSIPVTECGCWIWLGRLDKDGYGHISVDGVSITAPRASLLAFKGISLQANEVTRHTCDFPPCVNPDHLLTGTSFDNVQDRVRRGRNAKQRLTAADIPEIRRRHASQELKANIAADFGVSFNAIWKVVTGQTWKHVP